MGCRFHGSAPLAGPGFKRLGLADPNLYRRRFVWRSAPSIREAL
jgi:hypothetical protein